MLWVGPFHTQHSYGIEQRLCVRQIKMLNQTVKTGSCLIFCYLEINILGLQLTWTILITSNLYFVFFPKRIWWGTLSEGMSNTILKSRYSMLYAFSQSPGIAVSVINYSHFLGDGIVRKSSFETCQTLGFKPTNSAHKLLSVYWVLALYKALFSVLGYHGGRNRWGPQLLTEVR